MSDVDWGRLRAAARATQETLAATTDDATAAAGAIYDATGSTAATAAGRRVGTPGGTTASGGHLFDGSL